MCTAIQTASCLFPKFSWELVGTAGCFVQGWCMVLCVRNVIAKQSSSNGLILSDL